MKSSFSLRYVCVRLTCIIMYYARQIHVVFTATSKMDFFQESKITDCKWPAIGVYTPQRIVIERVMSEAYHLGDKLVVMYILIQVVATT